MRRAIGEKRGIAVSLATVAELALADGDGEGARPMLEECLALAGEIGHVQFEAFLTAELGLAVLYMGERDSARPLLEQALGQCIELGLKDATADCLSGLAALAGLAGDVSQAGRLFGASEAVSKTAGIEPSAMVRPIYDWLLPEIAAAADEQVFAANWQRDKLQSPAEAVA